MITNKVIEAIVAIKSDAQVSVSADDINTIVWENGETPISKADIEAKMAELQTAYNNKKYQRDRKKEYPSLQEFAEAYCEKEIGGNNTKWDEYVINYNKVRTDNPKS